MTGGKTVAVIDYGMGNLRSVCKALEHVARRRRWRSWWRKASWRIQLTSDPDVIRAADRVVFPGQGAIGACLSALDAQGLRPALLEATRSKPFLGLCLGLQALFEFSEEDGGRKTLGLLPGRVPRFPQDKMIDPTNGRPLKVPHMGWNQVQQTVDHPLWRGIPQASRFYFVHSYYAEPAAAEHITGITEYGIRFTSACGRDNIFAVQFHPEKSQQAGLSLLANFLHWDGAS